MASMQGKKKDKKQHGSKLRSFYLSCRGHLPCSSSSSSSNKYLPINPVPISKVQQLTSQENNRLPQKSRSSPLGEHQNEAVEVHWRRVSELERQLVELEDWLHMEVARLMSHLGTNNNNNNNRNTSTSFDGGFCKVWRLDDNGGYLYSLFDNEVLIDGALSQDLTIQISSPAIVPPEDGSTISQVLNRMAMMGRENLVAWLLDSIPMTDISTEKPTTLKPCTAEDPKDIQEAILLNAIPKLRELVLEGLQIQMGAKEVVKSHQENTNAYKRRGKIGETKTCVDDHGGIIMVVLIQPRDPQKAYRPVNEMMIGLIEASNVDEEGGFVINSVHVAGLMARRRNGKVISNCLWSL